MRNLQCIAVRVQVHTVGVLNAEQGICMEVAWRAAFTLLGLRKRTQLLLYLLGDPYNNKDYSMLGSILGWPGNTTYARGLVFWSYAGVGSKRSGHKVTCQFTDVSCRRCCDQKAIT